MTDEELESIANRLVDKITGDTPEGIVAGLAHLSAMRQQFRAPALYWSLMKTLADVLSIKCAQQIRGPHQ